MLKQITVLFIITLMFAACITKMPQDGSRLPVATIQMDDNIKDDIKKVEAEKSTQDPSLLDTISYFNDKFLRYDNYVYKNNIKTVQCHRAGWEMSTPIIELGKNEKLKLSFDDLEGDFKNYSYTIIHCNSDWQPSQLIESDFIEGFTSDYITSYKPSINTLQAYTHYNLVFPGNNVKPIISGNYILKVYLDKPENVVLTQRFKVFENLVDIDGRVRQATVIEDKNYKQEIVFSIKHNNFRISNPYNNVRVIIQQNERTDNKIKSLKPSLVRNNELIYEYEYGNVFDGNNEFRFFDIKNLKLYTENIERVQLRNNNYHVFLKTDERRSAKRYITQQDINGRFVVKNETARESDVEADYVYVYFSLPYNVPLIHGQMYVMGALSSWNLDDNAKMIYNYPAKTYEKALYLKQGYYNYVYAFLENGAHSADISFIEGTHSQTENEYTIFVYYKEPYEKYERLIGLKLLNSR